MKCKDAPRRQSRDESVQMGIDKSAAEAVESEWEVAEDGFV